MEQMSVGWFLVDVLLPPVFGAFAVLSAMNTSGPERLFLTMFFVFFAILGLENAIWDIIRIECSRKDTHGD